MNKVRQLTSTKSKSAILRALHGDIYTNERLTRFGLRDDPCCNHCDQIDTLTHRLTECVRTQNLVKLLEEKTKRLRSIAFSFEGINSIERLMASYKDSELTTLTLHSEIINAIIANQNTPEHVIVNNIVTRVLYLEKKDKIKRALRALLAD